jgi:Zn-dependent protease
MSASLAVCLALAVGIVGWNPAASLAWIPLVVVLGVAVSTLVHEGAHAWAAHNLGYRVEWVVLGGVAGVTAYFGRDDRPLERAAVALAGPAASGVLVLVLVGLRTTMAPSTTLSALVDAAIAVNALALVVNLVPVGGTDGAHLARGIVAHRRQRSRGSGHAAEPAPSRPPGAVGAGGGTAPTLDVDVPG